MSVALGSPIAAGKVKPTVDSPPNPAKLYAEAKAAKDAKMSDEAASSSSSAAAAASASPKKKGKAAAAAPVQPTSLTVEHAKEALSGVLAELKKEKVSSQIASARAEADGELDLIMEYVVPIFFEVQGHVMTRFGFTPNDAGFEAFANCLKAHESNAEFKVLADELKKMQKEATAVTAKKIANDDDDADAKDGDDDDDDGDAEDDDAKDS